MRTTTCVPGKGETLRRKKSRNDGTYVTADMCLFFPFCLLKYIDDEALTCSALKGERKQVRNEAKRKKNIHLT